MSIKSNALMILLSLVGSYALSISDIGLLVLPDEGRSNSFTCTTSDFDALAVTLDEKAMTFEDTYYYYNDMSVRRELQEENGGVISNDVETVDSKHRNLVNCASVCAGFAYGHCKLVYPECAPRRQLLDSPMDDVVTSTISQNLRGSERQLEVITILANGFVSGYSVNDPSASKLCSDLKASLMPDVVDITNQVSMTKSCAYLWNKLLKVGCVYMPAVP